MPQSGTTMTRFSVWRVITPFEDGEIDYPSYERLVDPTPGGRRRHHPARHDGREPDHRRGRERGAGRAHRRGRAGRVPVVVGLGGNDTRKVVKAVKHLEGQAVQGILSVCP